MKNFYKKVNDLLLNEDTDWDVLKKAVQQKYSFSDLYSTEEIRKEIEKEGISIDDLFSEFDIKERAREFTLSDLCSEREIKDFIIEYLEINL